MPRPGWTEDANLFIKVIADPSERKGPVERELRRPLDTATTALAARWGVAQREAEITRSIAVKAAAVAAEKAAKVIDATGRADALAEALDLDARPPTRSRSRRCPSWSPAATSLLRLSPR